MCMSLEGLSLLTLLIGVTGRLEKIERQQQRVSKKHHTANPMSAMAT